MDDRQFHDTIDELFLEVEDRVDELDLDIDIDSSGGVLTLVMPDGSSIILSRQVAAHEIWIAAKSGGFHLGQKGDDWVCGTTGEDWQTLLDRVLVEQGGQAIYH